MTWCLAIGFPILVVWVILTPISALVILSTNIRKDESNKIKQYMLILYQGLKQNRYYWEFVNSLRKVLILMSFSLFIAFAPFYRLMSAIIVLWITLRIQIYLNPYKDDKNNDIEILAILAGTLTLYSGLVFTSEDEQNSLVNAFILVFVMLYNLVFIIKWTYLFILCMSERYWIFQQILLLIKILACKNKPQTSKS